MKKLIFGLIATFLVNAFGFSQTSKELVNSFLTSNESKTILLNLKSYGNFDSNDYTTFERTLEDTKLIFLNFRITIDTKTVGYLQILQDKNGVFNQYVSLNELNTKTKSGSVVNYDLQKNVRVVTISVANDKLVDTKFEDVEYSNVPSFVAKRNPMDTNGNGDVSFFECYQFVNAAIDADGFSSWVCDFPVLGWLSCWGSTSTACAIYSANH